MNPVHLCWWAPRPTGQQLQLQLHFCSSTSQPLLISTPQPLHCLEQRLPFHYTQFRLIPPLPIISMTVNTTRYVMTSHRISPRLTHQRCPSSVSTPMAVVTSQLCRRRSMQSQTTAARGMLCGSTRASTCKQFSLFRLLDRDPSQNSALRCYWGYCYWSCSIVAVRRWQSQLPSPTSHSKGRGSTWQRSRGTTLPSRRTARSIAPQSLFSHQDSLRRT